MGSRRSRRDGLHAHFPAYDYDDMVRSQQMMLDDGMKVDHLRLILGTSMGCMQAFVWGETYPDSWMRWRRLRACRWRWRGGTACGGTWRSRRSSDDPAWMGGEYKTEPLQGLRAANDLAGDAGSAPLQMQKNYPTREAAEKYVDKTWRGQRGRRMRTT